jgi:hypothetical protein
MKFPVYSRDIGKERTSAITLILSVKQIEVTCMHGSID